MEFSLKWIQTLNTYWLLSNTNHMIWVLEISCFYLCNLPLQETGSRSTNSTNTPVLSASMTLPPCLSFCRKQAFFLSVLVVFGFFTLIFFHSLWSEEVAELTTCQWTEMFEELQSIIQPSAATVCLTDCDVFNCKKNNPDKVCSSRLHLASLMISSASNIPLEYTTSLYSMYN